MTSGAFSKGKSSKMVCRSKFEKDLRVQHKALKNKSGYNEGRCEVLVEKLK